MSGFIDNIIQKYNYVIHDIADPRTKDWWGVSNPFIVLSIVIAYLYFCESLGPRLMKNRKPFKLKTLMMLYNLFQVCFSSFLVYEGLVYLLHKDYNLACEPVDYSNNPRALRIAAGVWFYYVGKISELLDTILFVLRKKYNQVSFLHVYHHAMMSFSIWIGVKYIPGGHTILLGAFNSSVHVIMYTYYLISGFGPEYQKYVWWKKHLTKFQLIQFVVIFFHNFAVLFYKCDFPKPINVICCLNALIFVYMFGKFYLKSYKQRSKSKDELETKRAPLLTTKVNKYDTRKKLLEKTR